MNNEIWVIRNKETKEIWKAASGKTSWKKSNHAKNAWANSHNGPWGGGLLEGLGIQPKFMEYGSGYKKLINYKFDDQDKFELYNCAPSTTPVVGEDVVSIPKETLERFITISASRLARSSQQVGENLAELTDLANRIIFNVKEGE